MLCGGVVVGVGAESVCAACLKFIIISPQTPTQLAAAATAAVAPHAPRLGLYKHSTYEVLLDKQRRAKDPLFSHSNSLTFPLAQSLSHALYCALWKGVKRIARFGRWRHMIKALEETSHLASGIGGRELRLRKCFAVCRELHGNNKKTKIEGSYIMSTVPIVCAINCTISLIVLYYIIIL